MRFFPFFLLFWRINSKKKNRKWYIGVFRGNWNCITCESCVNYRLENRRFSESRRLPHRFSGSPDCVTAGDHVTPQVCQTFFRKRERPVSQNYTKSPAVKRPFSKFPSPPRLSLSRFNHLKLSGSGSPPADTSLLRDYRNLRLYARGQTSNTLREIHF